MNTDTNAERHKRLLAAQRKVSPDQGRPDRKAFVIAACLEELQVILLASPEMILLAPTVCVCVFCPLPVCACMLQQVESHALVSGHVYHSCFTSILLMF